MVNMKIKEILETIDKNDIPTLIAALEEKTSSKIKESFYSTGIFKAKLENGKIDVPDVEAESLNLSDGDVVQVLLRKIEKK